MSFYYQMQGERGGTRGRVDGRHGYRPGETRWAGGSESAQRVQQAPQFLGGKLTEPGIDIAFSPLEEYPAG